MVAGGVLYPDRNGHFAAGRGMKSDSQIGKASRCADHRSKLCQITATNDLAVKEYPTFQWRDLEAGFVQLDVVVVQRTGFEPGEVCLGDAQIHGGLNFVHAGGVEIFLGFLDPAEG